MISQAITPWSTPRSHVVAAYGAGWNNHHHARHAFDVAGTRSDRSGLPALPGISLERFADASDIVAVAMVCEEV